VDEKHTEGSPLRYEEYLKFKESNTNGATGNNLPDSSSLEDDFIELTNHLSRSENAKRSTTLSGRAGAEFL
jgi:hypothetical protein